MDDYRRRYLNLVGLGLIALGLAFVFGGWVGLHAKRSVVEQLPYLASGGIGGLAMIGAGATILHSVRQLRIEAEVAALAAKQEALEEALGRFIEAMSDRFDLRTPLAAAQRGRRRAPVRDRIPALRETAVPGAGE